MESDYNYINQADFDRILSAIPTLKIRKWSDYDIKMLFKILFYCALRPVEGINLEKSDFNLSDHFVRLRNTKTEKLGRARIPNAFYDELASYLSLKDDGRLFEGLTYETFYPWTRKLGKLLDITAWVMLERDTGEKTKGHIFRKSFGKEMLNGTYGEKAQNPAVIAKHLRHKKPSTTIDYYLKAGYKSVEDAI